MRLRVERNARYLPLGFVVTLAFGRGAGYIGGSTAFLAWNSGSRRWSLDHRGRGCPVPLELGFTRNSNRVPWAGEGVTLIDWRPKWILSVR